MWNIFRIEWEVTCQEERAMANKDGDNISKIASRESLLQK